MAPFINAEKPPNWSQLDLTPRLKMALNLNINDSTDRVLIRTKWRNNFSLWQNWFLEGLEWILLGSICIVLRGVKSSPFGHRPESALGD